MATPPEPHVPTPAATLDELVEVLNDGINFFGDAAELSRDGRHARLFRELRQCKQAIAEALRTAAPLGAHVRQGEGSLLSGLRQGYADLRARLSADPDQVYIQALEAHEDRIQAPFRTAVEHSPPSPVRDDAREKLPQVRRMHARLRELKHHRDDVADTAPLLNYRDPRSNGQENTMARKSLDRAGIDELLHQALETEIGGISVYETAIRCAVNDDLREEWQKYLEETRRHHEILLGVFEGLGLDTAMRCL